MSIFGLVSKKEHDALIKELQSVKATLDNLPGWLQQTAGAEQYNLPDPSIYANQADLFRKVSWICQAIDVTASAAAACCGLSLTCAMSAMETSPL